jgi:DNA-binding NtrC family response regulator
VSTPAVAGPLRILFVDDEPAVLQALRRMLRSRRQEWDMHFAGGGTEALALLEQMPFAAVVSDMRMPGMDGAVLLGEVQRRYPQTVRVILSGHADHASTVRSVGATHQYLAKPCDPDVLRATLECACGVRRPGRLRAHHGGVRGRRAAEPALDLRRARQRV